MHIERIIREPRNVIKSGLQRFAEIRNPISVKYIVIVQRHVNGNTYLGNISIHAKTIFPNEVDRDALIFATGSWKINVKSRIGTVSIIVYNTTGTTGVLVSFIIECREERVVGSPFQF